MDRPLAFGATPIFSPLFPSGTAALLQSNGSVPPCCLSSQQKSASPCMDPPGQAGSHTKVATPLILPLRL